MDSTRRGMLKMTGAGLAAFSLSGGPLFSAEQLPGEPAGAAQNKPKGSVMAIAAHPGDAFFAMGAPVALATHLGREGFFLSLSLGENGSVKIPPAQYGNMQVEASNKAATLLGAKALFLHYRDGEIPENDEISWAVCDLIRQYMPSVIVTHWKGSWHKDHRACHAIVQDAVFYASLPGIERQHPAHAIRNLYFADNWEDASEFSADTYLDISPAYDQWLNACAVFPMWRGENGFRYNDYYSSHAVAVGCLCGARQAVALMSTAENRTQRIRSL